MRHTLLFSTLACGLAAATAEPRVISMPLHRDMAKHARALDRTRMAKRDPFSVSLDGFANNGGFYLVNVTVGTPPQTISLDIDTGSSDVWMFGPQSCEEQTSLCYGGSFDSSASTSVANACSDASDCPPFQIQYGTPGSGVQGYYFQDVFGIGGQTVQNLTMAFATDAAYTTTGIMGIGFALGESLEGEEGTTYPSLVQVMAQQKLIPSESYSLYLDDLDAGEGTVLFGGYDTDKFEGNLAVLNIQPAENDQISRMLVIWSSIGVTDNTGASTIIPTSSVPQSALLDSGTALTVVPQDVFNSLTQYFGAVNDQELGAWTVPCDGLGAGTLDFGFGDASGPIISVPFNELAIPATDNDGNFITYKNGGQVCMLGLDVATDDLGIILGDTFLRSAYVVYDLGRKQIGIAQTRFNVSTSNVHAISGHSGNLASASSVVASGTTLEYQATAPATVQQGQGAGGETRSEGATVSASQGPATAASRTIAGGVRTTYANRATDIPGATGAAGGAVGSKAAAPAVGQFVDAKLMLPVLVVLAAVIGGAAWLF